MSIKRTIIVTAAIATAVAMVAPTFAGAVTVEELMAQISALQAQITGMQESVLSYFITIPISIVSTRAIIWTLNEIAKNKIDIIQVFIFYYIIKRNIYNLPNNNFLISFEILSKIIDNYFSKELILLF
jgi:hypothetical protein